MKEKKRSFASPRLSSVRLQFTCHFKLQLLSKTTVVFPVSLSLSAIFEKVIKSMICMSSYELSQYIYFLDSCRSKVGYPAYMKQMFALLVRTVSYSLSTLRGSNILSLLEPSTSPYDVLNSFCYIASKVSESTGTSSGISANIILSAICRLSYLPLLE